MFIAMPSEQDYELAAADYLEKVIAEACKTKEKVFIALSGGSTPLPILEELKERDLNWEQIHFFMVDERTVPLNNPESNFGAISEVFFNHISSKCYSMVQEGKSTNEAITRYESFMKDLMHFNHDGFPVFDLILLGMGDDGHTASLFPGTIALKENNKIVVENNVPQLGTSRITLTYPAIISAEKIIVLIKGETKKKVYNEIHTKAETKYPMHKIVLEREDVIWIVGD
ncbi:MAG: 6-phosphogluconolactonase [Maribacter sp.]|nr:6-phosphogluconolactonase [Maribacter sp.]MBT8313291.1 6-phosphogluconolactonase [Maribacter sp.]